MCAPHFYPDSVSVGMIEEGPDAVFAQVKLEGTEPKQSGLACIKFE